MIGTHIPTYYFSRMMDMVSIINFLDHCNLIGQNDSGMVYNVYPSSLRPAKYYDLREHTFIYNQSIVSYWSPSVVAGFLGDTSVSQSHALQFVHYFQYKVERGLLLRD